MTLYQRPDKHVFAEGARPGEVQPFPDLSRGWGVAFEQTGGIPPMEWFNFIGKRADEAIRYLMQRGLPEWSGTEEYPAGSYIQYAGQSYRAKVENKGKAPQNSLAEWEEWGLTRAALDECFHPKDGELAWPKITATPTTLSGYGITNAAPLDSPAFVGSPTAPTPNEAKDSSTKIATTAFTQNAILAAFNGPNQQLRDDDGFQKLPGGLILQWGRERTRVGSSTTITFPVKFPTVKLVVIVTAVQDVLNIYTTPAYATNQYNDYTATPNDRDADTASSTFNVHGRHGGRVSVRKMSPEAEEPGKCWLDWFALGY